MSMAEAFTIIFSAPPWLAYPRKLGSGSRGLAQDEMIVGSQGVAAAKPKGLLHSSYG
jgi:hypothetical protein